MRRRDKEKKSTAERTLWLVPEGPTSVREPPPVDPALEQYAVASTKFSETSRAHFVVADAWKREGNGGTIATLCERIFEQTSRFQSLKLTTLGHARCQECARRGRLGRITVHHGAAR